MGVFEYQTHAQHLRASSPVTLVCLTEWNLRALGSFNIATCILSQRIKFLSYTNRQMIVRCNLRYQRRQAKQHTSSANTREVMRRTLYIRVTESAHTTVQRQNVLCNRQAVPCTPKLAWYGSYSKNFCWRCCSCCCKKSKYCCLRQPVALQLCRATLLNIRWFTVQRHSSVVS